MKAVTSPHVVCRPALPSDTEDVLEFTKFIWEGHDYIKYVWRDWLADSQGLLAAAIYGPHTVGIARATLISPGQWWLEGFRVDPKRQGLKIGSHLHEYLDRWWLEHGEGTMRLMTSSERLQVHHLAARTGYTKVGEVWAYRAPAADQSQHGFTVVATPDVAAALRFASEHLAGTHQLVDLGWRFATPDQAALSTLAVAGRLFWWRGRAGLAGFWEDDEDGVRVRAISFAACGPDSLTPLLRDIPRLAAQGGYGSVLWLAPNEPEMQAAMTAAGFLSEWDHAGFLYEKHHP